MPSKASPLSHAIRIAAATGVEVLAETFSARAERGAGIPVIQRLAYLAEMAAGQLDGLRYLILVDTKSPVSFFAYPGKPSDLVPEGCEVIVLAGFAPVSVLQAQRLLRTPDPQQTTLGRLAAFLRALPRRFEPVRERSFAGLFAVTVYEFADR